LTRLGDRDLAVRLKDGDADDRRREVIVALDAIRSLERPRDPTANGSAIGAGIGAATGGALLLIALSVDRNEVDEWAPLYLGMTAAFTGVGALAGWAVDAARSKPAIRFDAPWRRGATIRVRPLYSRSRSIGIVLTVSP
jgi:hypothetical protein